MNTRVKERRLNHVLPVSFGSIHLRMYTNGIRMYPNSSTLTMSLIPSHKPNSLSTCQLVIFQFTAPYLTTFVTGGQSYSSGLRKHHGLPQTSDEFRSYTKSRVSCSGYDSRDSSGVCCNWTALRECLMYTLFMSANLWPGIPSTIIPTQAWVRAWRRLRVCAAVWSGTGLGQEPCNEGGEPYDHSPAYGSPWGQSRSMCSVPESGI